MARKKKSKFILSILLIIVGIFYFLILPSIKNNFFIDKTTSTNQPPKDEQKNVYTWIHSENTACGVPFDKDTSDDFIIVRDEYVLSYNQKRGSANWVAWKLTASDFGDVERYSGKFITDTTLPINYTEITHSEYTNTGYDRGHLVRSEERTSSDKKNQATFLLTNIIPQTPDLNRGPWYKFELYCQELCQEQGKDLYIFAGGIYDKNHTYLKEDCSVEIPDSCFKIIYIVPRGQKPTKKSESYAVIIPNSIGIRKTDFRDYSVSISHIEQSTGYDF